MGSAERSGGSGLVDVVVRWWAMQSTFVTSKLYGPAVIVRVEREKVGEHEAPIIQQEVTQAASPHGWRVAMDLSAVTLLASAGLGTLITLNKLCKSSGGKLALFGISEDILAVMKLTRLNTLLTISNDQESAVKAVS